MSQKHSDASKTEKCIRRERHTQRQIQARHTTHSANEQYGGGCELRYTALQRRVQVKARSMLRKNMTR